MVDVDTGRFTVGVFQDVAWARKGLEALKQAGLPADGLSILAKDSPEAASLIEQTFGIGGDTLEIPAAGTVLARGPLRGRAPSVRARDLGKLGLAGTMRRVGFQQHDGRIFEVLTARGGVLVAIRSEPRAAGRARRFCFRTAAATRPLAPGPAASQGTSRFALLDSASQAKHRSGGISFAVAGKGTRARECLLGPTLAIHDRYRHQGRRWRQHVPRTFVGPRGGCASARSAVQFWTAADPHRLVRARIDWRSTAAVVLLW